MMGIDPRDLAFRQYQGCLVEWNRRHSPDGGKAERGPQDFSRLKVAMAAHETRQ